MKKLLVLFLIGLVLFSAGCAQKQETQTSTTSSPTPTQTLTETVKPTESETITETQTTTTKIKKEINFKEYKRGEIIANWDKLFDSSVIYVSEGYEDLVRYYFPNAEIKPASEFQEGIAILSPKDARELLRGKPMLITINNYFGYVTYKVGYKFIGEDIGIMIAYKEDGKDRLIFTGNGKAGIGSSIRYAMELKEGKRQPNPTYTLRRGEFEGVVVKEIGDNDWDGIADEDEYWVLKEIYFKEPFIYNWRVVKGENVTVKGGFIRLVNGSTVYIRALGFNVSVEVKASKNAAITYVIENINPKIMELPQGIEVGETWIKFTTNKEEFNIYAKDIDDYTFIAFGDNRPGSGKKQPEVFLKLMDMMNNENALFVVSGGDLVYSGRVDEWGELMKVWNFNKPVFIAPGNHEYQGEGVNVYHKLFGPGDYSFILGNYYFIFINNVENGYKLSKSQWQWFEGELERAKDLNKTPVIVMHAPPVDPRPGGKHSMDEKEGKKVLELMRQYNAFGIFSHIHIYWYGEIDGVKFLVTGGAGAPLYAKEEEGGFYHYVKISVNDKIQVEPVKVS